MKCSIILAVLDSHEIFRRQLVRFEKILPAEFEVIVLDDGSDIPLKYDRPVPFPFRLLHTNDKRPWTNDLARNKGAAVASGEYLLMTDVDHVLTRETLDLVKRFCGDMLKFHRQVADLDEHGELRNIGESLAPHPNTFAIRKSLFERMGGYTPENLGYGAHDSRFRGRYQELVDHGRAHHFEVAGTIYVVTEAKWFHTLERQPATESPARALCAPAQIGDLVKNQTAPEITRAPRELLGDWNSFRLEDWKEDKNHKFLNRNDHLERQWRRLHELLPEYLPPDPRRRFLDVGSGNGASLEILRYLGHDAEGLDFTPGISDVDGTDWVYRPLIESQRLKCTVHDGAAVPYPYPDAHFDVVICYGVLTCFQPCSLWPQIFDEFARLAKSCILLGVNVGERYEIGKPVIEEWRHPAFELTHNEGAIYKWQRKPSRTPSAFVPGRQKRAVRLPLVFSGSRMRPTKL